MRHSSLRHSSLVLLALPLTVACTTTTPSAPSACAAVQGTSAAASRLATSNTEFAVRFFPAAVSTESNAVLSPYSVSTALMMLDTGARGTTDTQIQSTLDLPGNGTTIAPAYAALACADETHGSANGNQLSIADALWGQSGMSFEPAFLSTLSHGYGAPLQQANFSSDPSGATSAINDWVSSQTEGMIPALLDPSDVSSSTRFILVNAVYFKGAWATAFDPSATSPQPFKLTDGSSIQVPTMASTVTLGVTSGDGFTLVELPYQGDQLAMDFILPSSTLAELEASLTASALDAALAEVNRYGQTVLYLPKFSFTTRANLIPVLRGMGMTDVFMPGVADLSGIDGARDLFVGLILQEARVEVDEQGTVAAAATVVEGVTKDTGAIAPPPPIRIDQPFVFLIRDTSTKSVLFVGHVLNPTAS
jgi:serpin B